LNEPHEASNELSLWVRPTAEYLRQLPTLGTATPDSPNLPEAVRDRAPRHGVDYVLELKLETPRACYWLCTKGLPAPRAINDGMDNWVVGYVTVEPMIPDEDGNDDPYSYGPDFVKSLQGQDCLNFLIAKCKDLEACYEKAPTNQLAEQIEDSLEEIRNVSDLLESLNFLSAKCKDLEACYEEAPTNQLAEQIEDLLKEVRDVSDYMVKLRKSL